MRTRGAPPHRAARASSAALANQKVDHGGRQLISDLRVALVQPELDGAVDQQLLIDQSLEAPACGRRRGASRPSGRPPPPASACSYDAREIGRSFTQIATSPTWARPYRARERCRTRPQPPRPASRPRAATAGSWLWPASKKIGEDQARSSVSTRQSSSPEVRKLP